MFMYRPIEYSASVQIQKTQTYNCLSPFSMEIGLQDCFMKMAELIMQVGIQISQETIPFIITFDAFVHHLKSYTYIVCIARHTIKAIKLDLVYNKPQLF